MTQERPISTPRLTVHGAWHGDSKDPEREFRGQIAESDEPQLQVGTDVTVHYEVTDKRVAAADEHGRYLLTAGKKTYPLISFTCRSAATTGRHGTDDTQKADWQVMLQADTEK